MQEIKGLMATPTVRSAGGFRAAVPQLDTTVQKNANDALSNATKYFALRTRQEKQAEEDMLNARATSLINEYNLYGKDVLYGKNGAMYQKGTAVVTGVDGESWVSYNQGKLREKREIILSSLENNPRLRDRVAAGLEKLDVTFYSTLDAHFGQESHNYVVDQNTIRVDNASSAITAGGFTEDHHKEIYEAAATVARLSGKDPSNPVYKEAFDLSIQAKIGSAVLDGVKLSLDRGDIAGAKASLNSAFKYMPADTHRAAKELIDAAERKVFVDGAASNVSAEVAMDRTPSYLAASIVGSGNRVLSEELFTAAGMNKADAMRGGYGTNADTDRVTNARIMDGLYKRYGSMEAAIAATVLGVDAVDKAITSALDGGDPRAWINALSSSDKGRVTAAVNRYKNNATMRVTPTEGEIKARIRQKYPNITMEDVDEIAKGAMAKVVEEAEARKVRAEASARNALEALQSGAEIKASDLANLSPEQIAALSLIKARQRMSNPPSDMRAYLRFQDPQELKAMSNADFMLLGPAYLSEEDFAEASVRRDRLRGVKNVDELYVSRDDVSYLVKAHFRHKDAEYEKSEDGKYVINKTIDFVRRELQKQANESGRELTKEEIESRVSSVLRGNQFYVPLGISKSGHHASLFDFKYGDLSDFAKDLSKPLAELMYGDAFETEDSRLSAIQEFLLFPESTDLPDRIVREMERNYGELLTHVRAVFKAETKKELTDKTAIRLALYAAQKDPEWLKKFIGVENRR